jgi:hypothetical protein
MITPVSYGTKFPVEKSSILYFLKVYVCMVCMYIQYYKSFYFLFKGESYA